LARQYELKNVPPFLPHQQELHLLITGPTTGVIETSIEEIRVDEVPVDEAKKGEHFSIRIDEPIRASDKIYKIVSNE